MNSCWKKILNECIEAAVERMQKEEMGKEERSWGVGDIKAKHEIGVAGFCRQSPWNLTKNPWRETGLLYARSPPRPVLGHVKMHCLSGS
jgi:hypothetical protein